MRTTLRILRALFVLLGLGLVAGAHAQETYPSKVVRFIVPFPAGTSPDVVMRILGVHLSQLWGQQVVIDNRVGAAGNIGASAAANASPDGYTLLYAVNSVVTANPHLYSKLAFDPMKMVPVTMTTKFGFALLARNNLPAKDLKEFLATAKAQPGKMSYASFGIGTTGQIYTELLLAMTGIQMLHVPMGQSAMNPVLGGDVDIFLTPYATAAPDVATGRARALGVTGVKPLETMPDVPIIGQIVPGYTAEAWHGVFAPAGTSPAIVNKLSADIIKVLAMPEVRKRLTDLGLEPLGIAPAEFAKLVQNDYEKLGQIIRNANIKLE